MTLLGTSTFDERMRALLLAGGPINTIGALIFAPPVPWVRNFVGLPEPHPLYLWILSSWILAFGVAYFRMGLTRRVERSLLAVSAAGKATFALALVAYAIAGEIPMLAGAVGLPDLAIAAVYVMWLVRNP